MTRTDSEGPPKWVQSKARQWTILRRWNLISRPEGQDSKTTSHGVWKPEPLAYEFIAGNVKVPDEIHTYKNKVIGRSRKLVSIQDVVGNQFVLEKVLRGEFAAENFRFETRRKKRS